MARDNEYLTSNLRIRYPFSDDSVLKHKVTRGSAEILEDLSGDLELTVFGMFADAYVQVKSPYENIEPVITGISVRANTLRFSIIDRNHPDYHPVNVTCVRSGTRFPVIKGENEWCWYVVVASSDGIVSFMEKLDAIGDISSNVLTLNNRCLGQTASGVSSVWVYGGKGRNVDGLRYTREEAMLHSPDVIITDSVDFKVGYNMKMEADGDDGIEFTAEAGAGLGKAPCEDVEECVIFKTPGIVSKDGHTRMFNDTCYDFITDRADNLHGFLYMHVKCKSCCTCEMYEEIVNNRLLPLSNEILSDRDEINDIRATYEDTVTKWNKRLATALPEDIVTSITAIPLDAAATELKHGSGGKMNRCGFSVMMKNDSFVTVTFKLESFLSNGVAFESQISYMDSNSKPVLIPVTLYNTEGGDSSSSDDHPLFTINLAPGRSAVLTYFIRLDDFVLTEKQTGFFSNLEVVAYQDTRRVDTRFLNLVV